MSSQRDANPNEPTASGKAPGIKPATPSGAENSARKILRFSDLARCGDEVWIEYENKLYRLQSTRQGKLILTK
ncbi:hemin uptake protein HemP [Rubripirellula reticaptiva]|nr:hemin uptake protein HemP [Rubripirellula reticaptiva]